MRREKIFSEFKEGGDGKTYHLLVVKVSSTVDTIPDWYCAYIGFPENSLMYGLGTPDAGCYPEDKETRKESKILRNWPVPGGVTWAGHLPDGESGYWYIGWDYAHYDNMIGNVPSDFESVKNDLMEMFHLYLSDF